MWRGHRRPSIPVICRLCKSRRLTLAEGGREGCVYIEPPQTDRQTYRQTDRQTYRQTHAHVHTLARAHMHTVGQLALGSRVLLSRFAVVIPTHFMTNAKRHGEWRCTMNQIIFRSANIVLTEHFHDVSSEMKCKCCITRDSIVDISFLDDMVMRLRTANLVIKVMSNKIIQK